MSTEQPKPFDEDEIVAFIGYLHAAMRAHEVFSLDFMLDTWNDYRRYGLSGKPEPEQKQQMFGIETWKGGHR